MIYIPTDLRTPILHCGATAKRSRFLIIVCSNSHFTSYSAGRGAVAVGLPLPSATIQFKPPRQEWLYHDTRARRSILLVSTVDAGATPVPGASHETLLSWWLCQGCVGAVSSTTPISCERIWGISVYIELEMFVCNRKCKRYVWYMSYYYTQLQKLKFLSIEGQQ